MVTPKSHTERHPASPLKATPAHRLTRKAGTAAASRDRRLSDAVGKGRDEISDLVATEPEYKVLFSKIMEVAKRYVEFDWANLFVYTAKSENKPEREYSRIICWCGPLIEYPTRWFYIEPEYRGWIDQPQTWMADLKEDVSNGPAPHLLDRADLKISVEAGTKALIVLPVREGGEVKAGLCLMSRRKGIYNAETR